MSPLPPADELAQVRAQIARLKTREAALVAALTAAPEAARNGRLSRAEVVERRLRLFDHRLLPARIREDPLFWRERVVIDVECHEVLPAGLAAVPAGHGAHPLQ